MADLTQLEEHFSFGANWRDYARLIDEARVMQATADLQRLLGGRIDGCSFLDIGCGSGLHALAALRSGATEVVGVDLDPHSVETARAVLERFAPGRSWRIAAHSVFELPEEFKSRFDVVYSWGVLHHTGDMWRAIESAAAQVAPNGRLTMALYRRTLMCSVWRLEKRWYTHATAAAQERARSAYVALFRLRRRMTRRHFEDYVADYGSSRGMDFSHDVHDWLGGYPYESVDAGVLADRLKRMGYVSEYTNAHGFSVGLLGSGCNEYTFRKTS